MIRNYTTFILSFFAILLFAVPQAHAQFGLPSGLFGIGSGNDFTNWLEPLVKQSEQMTSNRQARETQNSTTTDAELTTDTEREQNVAVHELAHRQFQTDELGCSVTSLATLNATQQMTNKMECERQLTENFMAEIDGMLGTISGLSAPQEAELRARLVAQQFTGAENNGNYQALVDAFSGQNNNGDTSDLAICNNPAILIGARTNNANISANSGSEMTCVRQWGGLISSLELPPETLIDQEETRNVVDNYGQRLRNHKALLASSMAKMMCASMASPADEGGSSNTNQILALLEQVGASENLIEEYLPLDEDGNRMGISEDAQFEVLTKFYLTNPNFFTGLQLQERNVKSIRTLIQSLHTRLDDKILEMQKIRVRHMSAIASIDINERRTGIERDILNASLPQ